MKTMRGIEPIIAVVILVAVTLVIAIGVIGWIMGWWGTMGATESLQIYPDSILYSNGTLILHIKNTGTAAAVIYKVEIVGIGAKSTTETLTPGEDKTLTVSISATGITPGANYQVKIYTQAGNVYQTTLQARVG